MATELPNSSVDRTNILNNPYAIEVVRDQVGIKGTFYNNELKLTTSQVAKFYEVELRTIERYLSNYGDELKQNGYEVYTGERLRELKAAVGTDMNVGTKTTVLGVFNFKAFVNIGMLLVESEKARLLRKLILDVVIDIVSSKTGGTTKYINQRDEYYLVSTYLGQNYRKEFIDSLKNYVDMGGFKYAIYTNKIYKSIFKEHAQEYKRILSLEKDDNVRDTMYSEVLTTISMYETGLANEIKRYSEKENRKISPAELDDIFVEFERNPAWKPQIEMARMKMASRDYGLRSVMHSGLSEYVTPLDTDDFDRFLGEKSMELSKRIEQHKDVFRRLKEK